MLTVVIPAYNEEKRLSKTLPALKEYMGGREHEIVVVDDGSADRTAKVASMFGCRVIRHAVNLGKGAAVKTGVLVSRGNLVLVTDADLATPMEELSKLEAALESGADVAVGSRETPGAVVRRISIRRRLAGKVFNLMVRVFMGLPYFDTQCGFKLFKRDAAWALFTLAECRGYSFDVEVLVLAREMGFKVREVGVIWRDKSGSKVRLLWDGFRMLKELAKIRQKCAAISSPAIPGTSAPGSASSVRRDLFTGDTWYFRARKRVLSGFIKQHLPAGTRVLDVGCGDGWLAEALPECEWYSVEPDVVLRGEALSRGMMAAVGIAENLPFEDRYFDAVCIFDVLEHLPDEAPALMEAQRVLKPGGMLFISVPLHPELWSRHDMRCGHYRRYRKGEVIRLFEGYGFRLVERRFFMSLPLPLVWATRRLSLGEPGRMPGVLDTLAKRLLRLTRQCGCLSG